MPGNPFTLPRFFLETNNVWSLFRQSSYMIHHQGSSLIKKVIYLYIQVCYLFVLMGGALLKLRRVAQIC